MTAPSDMTIHQAYAAMMEASRVLDEEVARYAPDPVAVSEAKLKWREALRAWKMLKYPNSTNPGARAEAE